MSNLKQVKIFIGRNEIAERIGVDANEMWVSGIELNPNTQNIEFLITMGEDTVVDSDFETSSSVVDVGNLRRQSLLNKLQNKKEML